MDMFSRLVRWAPRLTQATGIVLGIIHLIATPFLIGWSSRQLHPDHALLVIAAMRLNHVLVGILLLPLGISTFWSGKALEQSWSLRLAGLNAATLLYLPILLAATMPLESLEHRCFGWRSREPCLHEGRDIKRNMSDVRRRRQQERVGTPDASPPSRTKLVWGGVVVLLIGAYAAWWYYANHRYNDFAKCLSSKQVKMYGAYWCPHCAEQKEEFGGSFRFVNYVECAIKDSREMAPACKAAGVKHFPTWQFGAAGPLVEGKFPLQELSDKTGCALP